MAELNPKRVLNTDHDESVSRIRAEASSRLVCWRWKFAERDSRPQVLSVSVPDVRYFAALLRGVSFVNASERVPPPLYGY